MAYLTNTDISHIEADKAAAERINIEHQKTIDNINEHLKVTEYEGLSIDDLDLSVRAYNILKRTGIAEVRDLAKMTFEEIDNIEKFTPKLTMEVINKLRKFGIEIK